MRRHQKGFSLVELVIVIVVVGLLAVAALPRFLNVTEEAKKASIQGVSGAFSTAVLSVRAQWEAEARTNSDIAGTKYNTVKYDGTEFVLTSKTYPSNGSLVGYPYSVDTAAAPALDADGCKSLMDNLLQSPPKVTTDKKGNYQAEYGSGKCKYTQLEGSSGHYFEYDPTKGRVNLEIQP